MSAILTRLRRTRHRVFGCGGTRAYLNGAGAILACDLVGIADWDSELGISGGSIPALLTAHGMPAWDIVDIAVTLHFADLLQLKRPFGTMLKEAFLKGNNPIRVLRDGMVTSDRLGQYLESLVPSWPKRFVTAAVSGRDVYVFDINGIHVYRGNHRTQISTEPLPVGVAIRASCAVPSVLEAVQMHGLYVYDGGLSRFGRCPTKLARLHFQADPDQLMAIDVSSNRMVARDRIISALARLMSRTMLQRQWRRDCRAGISICTALEDFPSMDFDMSTELKRTAVLAGFRATCNQLHATGYLAADRYTEFAAKSTTWEELSTLR